MIGCMITDFRLSREKSDKEIMREIQAIMRQIASSITYLPCLDEPCKNYMFIPDQCIVLCFDDFLITITELCDSFLL
jgi:hypothetical protein